MIDIKEEKEGLHQRIHAIERCELGLKKFIDLLNKEYIEERPPGFYVVKEEEEECFHDIENALVTIGRILKEIKKDLVYKNHLLTNNVIDIKEIKPEEKK